MPVYENVTIVIKGNVHLNILPEVDELIPDGATFAFLDATAFEFLDATAFEFL